MADMTEGVPLVEKVNGSTEKDNPSATAARTEEVAPPNDECFWSPEGICLPWINSSLQVSGKVNDDRSHGILSREGLPLLHFFAHYGGTKVVSLFFRIYRSLTVLHEGGRGLAQIKRTLSSIFSSEKTLPLILAKVDDRKEFPTMRHLPAQFKGHLGILRHHPEPPEPLPSGVYGEVYRKSSDARAETCYFFLNAIRADQKDTVAFLLDHYELDSMKATSSTHDPLFAAVLAKNPQMIDLLVVRAKTNDGYRTKERVDPIESGNNAGDAGDMSCGMEDYSLSAAVDGEHVPTLETLCRHVRTTKMEQGVEYGGSYTRSKIEKAFSAAVRQSSITSLKLLLEVAQIDPNIKFRPCCCRRGYHCRIKEGTTPLHRVVHDLYLPVGEMNSDGWGKRNAELSTERRAVLEEMEKLLLKHGARWDAADGEGVTPLDIRQGNGSVVNMKVIEAEERERLDGEGALAFARRAKKNAASKCLAKAILITLLAIAVIVACIVAGMEMFVVSE